MTEGLNLDCRLVLEDPMRSPDGAGGFTESWTALGFHWAHVRPLAGRQAGGGSVLRHRIYVRRMPQGAASRPRPDQRFRDGDRLFYIEAVTDLPEDPRHSLCYAIEERAA